MKQGYQSDSTGHAIARIIEHEAGKFPEAGGAPPFTANTFTEAGGTGCYRAVTLDPSGGGPRRTALQKCRYNPAITLYAASGRLIPFNSNSPAGSTGTAFSTFINTGGDLARRGLIAQPRRTWGVPDGEPRANATASPKRRQTKTR